MAAPNFKVVAKPNDWSREVGQAARRIESEALTDTKQKQLAFWTLLREHLHSSQSPVRPRKAYPQHWMDFSVGRANFWVSATLNAPKHRAGVEFNLQSPSVDADFAALRKAGGDIEQQIGHPLEWMELPGRKSSRIALFKTGFNPLDEASWPELLVWMKTYLERFDAVFRPLIRSLNSDDDPDAEALIE